MPGRLTPSLPPSPPLPWHLSQTDVALGSEPGHLLKPAIPTTTSHRERDQQTPGTTPTIFVPLEHVTEAFGTAPGPSWPMSATFACCAQETQHRAGCQKERQDRHRRLGHTLNQFLVHGHGGHVGFAGSVQLHRQPARCPVRRVPSCHLLCRPKLGASLPHRNCLDAALTPCLQNAPSIPPPASPATYEAAKPISWRVAST